MFDVTIGCLVVTMLSSMCSGITPTPRYSVTNGFVHLSFYPLPLDVTMHGSRETGYINVTVTDIGYHGNDVMTLHTCCLDDQIGMLAEEKFSIDFTLDGPKWFVFNISVVGVRLGRANIRFYVSHNSSQFDRHVSSSSGDHMERARSERYLTYHKETSLINKIKSRTNGVSATSDRVDPPDWHTQANFSEYALTKHDLSPLSRQRRDLDVNLVKRSNLSNEWPDTEWWLLGRYEVVVRRPVNWLEPWLDYLVMVFIGLNMLGVGGQIDAEEVLYLIKKPAAVSICMFCRFGIMPALGLGLVELMKPSHTVSLGVLSMLCSPHEGASSLLVLLAERDLTLSVTLICIVNFTTVALLPLWTIVFETRIYDIPGQAEIPFREIFIVFGYLLVCVTLGYILERKYPKLYAKFWEYLPPFTIITLLLIFVVEVYKSSFIFELITAKVFFMAAMLAVAGYLFGCAVAFIARQPLSRIIVISIETGCRTTYITCLLLNISLTSPESDIARTTPVLGGILSLIPGLVAVLIYRGYSRYMGRNYAATECTIVESKERLESFSSDPSDCGEDEAEDELTQVKETSM